MVSYYGAQHHENSAKTGRGAVLVSLNKWDIKDVLFLMTKMWCINVEIYADDNQLYKVSIPPTIYNMAKHIEKCCWSIKIMVDSK